MGKKKGCLLILIVGILLFISPVFFTLRRMSGIKKGTDHKELLAACKGMMQSRTSFRTRMDSLDGQSDIALDDPAVPEIIRLLKPSYVLVSEDVATVEMGGGGGHFGVVAFAQGNDTTNRIPGWGQKKQKLIDGLWYYSD
jgi:hypothetical protein